MATQKSSNTAPLLFPLSHAILPLRQYQPIASLILLSITQTFYSATLTVPSVPSVPMSQPSHIENELYSAL